MAISVGEHSCALSSGGGVACWGSNAFGEVGDGSTTTRSLPVAVSGGVLAGLTVVAISSGESHTCALTSAGAVACWGANGAGQIGDGTTTNRLSPVAVMGFP